MLLEEREQRDIVAYEVGKDLQRRAPLRLLRGAAACARRVLLGLSRGVESGAL